MGYLIGGPDGFVGTWGKMRRAMGQINSFGLNYSTPTISEPNNLEWQVQAGDSFFKSAATGGFVKGGFLFTPPTLPSYANIYGPFINISSAPNPANVLVAVNSFEDGPLLSDLTGQTVTGYGGTFNITAAMNTSFVTVVGGGPVVGTPISAIGLMTPI
jgi:hypothetical protein